MRKFLSKWKAWAGVAAIASLISWPIGGDAQAHEVKVGQVIVLGAFCSDLDAYETIYATVFRPNNVAGYTHAMVNDKKLKCFDTRLFAHMGARPFGVRIVELLETRKMEGGHTIMLIAAESATSPPGESDIIYTWDIHSSTPAPEADPAAYTGKEHPV